MKSFSVVVPILNDAELLPITLPSVLKLHPTEIVPVFGDCTDKSPEIFMKICDKYDFKNLKPLFSKKRNPEYKFQLAYDRRLGFENTTYDTILNIDADLILDQKIKNIIQKFNGGLVSLGFKNYPRTLQDYIRKITNPIRRSLKHEWTMTYIFSKKQWKKTENLEEVKNLIAGEDQHLKNAIKKKYPYKFVETNTIHLRPKENPRRHYVIGYNQWIKKRSGLPKQILYSIFMLKPWQIIGYYHARFKNIRAKSR